MRGSRPHGPVAGAADGSGYLAATRGPAGTVSGMTSLTDLDGLPLFALTSGSAHGCQKGTEIDFDDQRRAHIVLPAAGAEQIVEDIKPLWDALWLTHPELDSPQLRRAAAICEGLGRPLPSRPTHTAPTWGPLWTGTLAQYATAARDHERVSTQYAFAADATLRWARLELFRQAGATLTSAHIPAALPLAHDFGCSCGLAPLTDYEAGDGHIVLRVRDGRVLATPAAMSSQSLDEVLAETAQDAERTRLRAAQRAAAESTVDKLLDLRVPIEPTAHEADLTYTQWLAARYATANQRSAEVAANAASPAHSPRGTDDGPHLALMMYHDVAALTSDEAERLAGLLL